MNVTKFLHQGVSGGEHIAMVGWNNSIKMIRRIGIVCVLIISLFTVANARITWGQETLVKIGILAKRGTARCLEKWSPTAEYLTANIPGKTFVIVPLDYDQIYRSIENGEVDFILANPSFYVKLESWYGVSRIATLKNMRLGGVYTEYGGVIFCKANRSDIQHLEDLKDKTFMAADETSLGGWRAAWRELKNKGIDPYHDFKEFRFGGTHDVVVYAVRDWKVDAGAVRTDTLERMQAEGKINLQDFHVIHGHVRWEVPVPFLHSTRSYPEWPFAKVKQTSAELTEKVAIALLKMSRDSAAAKAARCAGWTIPLNYQSVHECLKELKLGPYKDLGNITPLDIFKQYWQWILAAFVLFAAMASSTFIIIRLNRNIRNSHVRLQQEVEERKRTEEALRESEEHFRELVENSLVGISIIKNDQIVYQNPEQEKLFGHLLESLQVPNFENVYPEDVKKVKEFYQKTRSGENGNPDINFRFYPFGKKGSKANMRWVQCRASLIQYQGGKAILLNVMDVTRTKELERLVMMQDKMASLGCVAAGIAHEVRNPLTGVNTYLYTLEELCNSDTLEQKDLEMVRQIVGQIKVASNKIESVIRRVMDFSRPGSPEMVLVDINRSLQEAINLSSVTLRKARIKIEESLDQDLPQCYANPNLIEQVILNLINNAAKAMENTYGTKNIKITSYLKNSSIIVGISDSGPGVPFEIRDRIFDPFFSNKDGMGIGLSIVHRIITDHGGSLYVDTSEWGGAEFRIELPIKKKE